MPQDVLENIDVDLSNDELAALTTNSGESMVEPQALATAQAAMPMDEKHRLKSLTTGHKLRIIADLKEGLTPDEVCIKHRLTKSSLALIAGDTSFQEITNASYINQTKKLMASRFYQLADMALSHIDPQALSRLDPYKLGMLAAIALDKARLIEGQSTENLSFKSLAMNIHGTLDQLKERKDRLMLLLEQRRSGGTMVSEAQVVGAQAIVKGDEK